jgi:hypothetical protein
VAGPKNLQNLKIVSFQKALDLAASEKLAGPVFFLAHNLSKD